MSEEHLVELSADHPGFSDPIYRSRRNQIAALAIAHHVGEPAPIVAYTTEEEAVWRTVLERLTTLHATHACRGQLEGAPRLAFDPARIPQLVEVSALLHAASGFSLQPVAGLVTPRVFLEHLADGVFLATQYMRHHSRPLYTPEPDVIHELVGHAALLTEARYATINRLFGEATRRADDTTVEKLIRVYWYAIEFGLVREGGRPRAFGAGLLSSIGELERATHGAELRPFSIEEIARTPFDPTHYQAELFVAESSAALLDELEAWLTEV
jgi:phenylalanine-4-hydroxylase